MSTSVSRPSATIYQFPVGGRASAALERDGATKAPPVPVIYESVWYHAEAIKDTDTTRPQ
jgi:hypothetical protein